MKPILLSLIPLLALTTFPAVAGTNPAYDPATGELQVTAVDIEGSPGAYQNIVLQHQQDDLWRLVDVVQAVQISSISTVELITTSSFPVQVFLKVSGVFYSGCPQLGEFSIDRQGLLFDVALTYEINEPFLHPDLWGCTANVPPFSRTYPLPVYGLEAGTYTYRLNNKFSGTFTLGEDNVLK